MEDIFQSWSPQGGYASHIVIDWRKDLPRRRETAGHSFEGASTGNLRLTLHSADERTLAVIKQNIYFSTANLRALMYDAWKTEHSLCVYSR